MSNVSITNNYVGFGLFGQYYPGTDQLRDRVREHCRRFLESNRFSPSPCAAYVAALPPTAKVISETSTVSATATGSAPTTLLGNGFAGAGLAAAGSGETNFVGGPATTSVRRSGREHSDLSRHRRRRRRGVRIRSGEGRDRSQPHRRRHPHSWRSRPSPSSAPLHSAVALRCAINSIRRTIPPCPGRPRWRYHSRFYDHARGTETAHRRQLRAHADSVVDRYGEWRRVVLYESDDGRRRAD